MNGQSQRSKIDVRIWILRTRCGLGLDMASPAGDWIRPWNVYCRIVLPRLDQVGTSGKCDCRLPLTDGAIYQAQSHQKSCKIYIDRTRDGVFIRTQNESCVYWACLSRKGYEKRLIVTSPDWINISFKDRPARLPQAGCTIYPMIHVIISPDKIPAIWAYLVGARTEVEATEHETNMRQPHWYLFTHCWPLPLWSTSML